MPCQTQETTVAGGRAKCNNVPGTNLDQGPHGDMMTALSWVGSRAVTEGRAGTERSDKSSAKFDECAWPGGQARDPLLLEQQRAQTHDPTKHRTARHDRRICRRRNGVGTSWYHEGSGLDILDGRWATGSKKRKWQLGVQALLEPIEHKNRMTLSKT